MQSKEIHFFPRETKKFEIAINITETQPFSILNEIVSISAWIINSNAENIISCAN